jgi:hypothetical protein
MITNKTYYEYKERTGILMRQLHRTDERYKCLLSIPRIINGEVELFVNSIFNNKRRFDKYIRIWYGYIDDETIHLPYNNMNYQLYVKRVLYEITDDKEYYKLRECDIIELLLDL